MTQMIENNDEEIRFVLSYFAASASDTNVTWTSIVPPFVYFFVCLFVCFCSCRQILISAGVFGRIKFVLE